MRVLIDECIDWRIVRDLAGVEAKTVRQMGWSGTVNGALLTLAASANSTSRSWFSALAPTVFAT